MEMSIDEAIRYYENKNVVLTEEEALANTVAIEIMRKYKMMQADYETRLKADMVAMLTEIQLEIEEFMGAISPNYDEAAQDISQVIQQKINSLKVESEPKESEDNNGSNNN